MAEQVDRLRDVHRPVGVRVSADKQLVGAGLANSERERDEDEEEETPVDQSAAKHGILPPPFGVEASRRDGCSPPRSTASAQTLSGRPVWFPVMSKAGAADFACVPAPRPRWPVVDDACVPWVCGRFCPPCGVSASRAGSFEDLVPGERCPGERLTTRCPWHGICVEPSCGAVPALLVGRRGKVCTRPPRDRRVREEVGHAIQERFLETDGVCA